MAKTRPFGSIRRLNSGRYQARYWHGDKQVPADTTFVTKADARAWLARMETEVLGGNHLDPNSGREKFGHFAERWLEHRDIRPRTRETYASQLTHILAEFEKAELRRITPSSVRAWHGRLAKSGLHPNTVAKVYRLFRTMMDTAVDDGLVRVNPVHIKGAAAEQAIERPILEWDDVRRIAEAIHPRFHALVWVAATSGLRFGELGGLSRRHVDLEAGTLRVEGALVPTLGGGAEVGPPKSVAAYRTVTVPAMTIEVLSAHLDAHVEDEPDALVSPRSRAVPSSTAITVTTGSERWPRSGSTRGQGSTTSATSPGPQQRPQEPPCERSWPGWATHPPTPRCATSKPPSAETARSPTQSRSGSPATSVVKTRRRATLGGSYRRSPSPASPAVQFREVLASQGEISAESAASPHDLEAVADSVSMRRSRRFALCRLAALTVFLLAAGCGSGSGSTGDGDASGRDLSDTGSVVLRLSGSGTASPLVARLAEEYVISNEHISFDFGTGTNTGGGVQGVVDGTLDLSVANRPLKDEEAAKGVDVHAFAVDAMVFAVNQPNAVLDMSTADVQSLYSGEVTDWSQLGGEPQTVFLLGRDADESATKLFFDPIMGDTERSPAISVLARSTEMVDALESTPGAVGFTSLGLLGLLDIDTVEAVTLDGVTPGPASMSDGSYSWVTTFSVVTPPGGMSVEVRAFVDYITSPEAVPILEQYGYAAAR